MDPGERGSPAHHGSPSQPTGRRARRLLQVRRTRHGPRHRDQGRPDHVHGHGLHHLPEREHHRQAARPRPDRGLGRDGAHRRDHDDRHGPGRELPVRPGGRSRDQRDRRLQPDRQGPRREGRDGRDRARGHRDHDPRRGRPARGDHERGADRPQALDRRRDRPVHPVHRLRQRRADRVQLRPRLSHARVLQRHARHAGVPDARPASSSSCSAWRSRSCSMPARSGPR